MIDDDFELCDPCQGKYDRLYEEMYLELKSLGSDDEEREDIQDAYWCELDDILENCLNNH